MDDGQIAEMGGETILKDLYRHKSDLKNIIEKQYPDYNLKIKQTSVTPDKITYKIFFITDQSETAEGYVIITLNNQLPVYGKFNFGGITGKLSFK